MESAPTAEQIGLVRRALREFADTPADDVAHLTALAISAADLLTHARAVSPEHLPRAVRRAAVAYGEAKRMLAIGSEK